MNKKVKEFKLRDDKGEMIINNKGYTCYLDGRMTTYGTFRSDSDAFDQARHYIIEIWPENINDILNFLNELEKEC